MRIILVYDHGAIVSIFRFIVINPESDLQRSRLSLGPALLPCTRRRTEGQEWTMTFCMAFPKIAK